MKTMKKMFALVLALVLCLSLAVPAMAASSYDLTVKVPLSGHQYGAYQIFKGDLHDGVLSNVDWGSGIDKTKLYEGKNIYQSLGALSLETYDELGNSKGFSNIFKKVVDGVSVDMSSAAEVADAITKANWSHDDTGLKKVAKVFGAYLTAPEKTSVLGAEVLNADNVNYEYKISGLSAGYYLVKDEGSYGNGENEFYTDYLLHISATTTINAKGNVPEVNKSVFNATHNQFMEYGDTYTGKEITFCLEGSLPAYFAEYDSYWTALQDNFSEGLDFLAIKKVYVLREGGTVIDVTHLKDADADKETENNGTIWELHRYDDAGNALPVSDTTTRVDKFVVYFPQLKNQTFVGKDAANNDFSMTVRYTDKLVVEYTAKLNDKAVIGAPGNPNEGILIYDNDPTVTGHGSWGTTPEDETKVYTYSLELVKVDENDNTIKLKDAEFEMWLYIDGVKNFAVFDKTSHIFRYWVPEASKGTIDTSKETIALTTDASGKFTVSGLDVGGYRLTETKAPSGYNKLTTDVLVDIRAGYSAAGELTSLTCEVNGATAAGDVDTGTVTVQVTNKTGATLPSTGGIGTTMFYIAGGLMVALAVVLLVTKKRMAEEQ